MRVFVDTSAFLALLQPQDHNHADAKRILIELQRQQAVLVTTNYILVETTALVQRRLGITAVQDLQKYVFSAVEVRWIDETLHQVALSALLVANRRQLSLVDCTSFEVCRRFGINNIFAFDEHFVEQDFHCLM